MNDVKRAFMQRRLAGKSAEQIWDEFQQGQIQRLKDIVQAAFEENEELREAGIDWNGQLRVNIPGKVERAELLKVGERIVELSEHALKVGSQISQAEKALEVEAKITEKALAEMRELQGKKKKKNYIPDGWLDSGKPRYSAASHKGIGK